MVYKKKTFFFSNKIRLRKIIQNRKGRSSEAKVIYLRVCEIKNGYFLKNNH